MSPGILHSVKHYLVLRVLKIYPHCVNSAPCWPLVVNIFFLPDLLNKLEFTWLPSIGVREKLEEKHCSRKVLKCDTNSVVYSVLKYDT